MGSIFKRVSILPWDDDGADGMKKFGLGLQSRAHKSGVARVLSRDMWPITKGLYVHHTSVTVLFTLLLLTLWFRLEAALVVMSCVTTHTHYTGFF